MELPGNCKMISPKKETETQQPQKTVPQPQAQLHSQIVVHSKPRTQVQLKFTTSCLKPQTISSARLCEKNIPNRHSELQSILFCSNKTSNQHSQPKTTADVKPVVGKVNPQLTTHLHDVKGSVPTEACVKAVLNSKGQIQIQISKTVKSFDNSRYSHGPRPNLQGPRPSIQAPVPNNQCRQSGATSLLPLNLNCLKRNNNHNNNNGYSNVPLQGSACPPLKTEPVQLLQHANNENQLPVRQPPVRQQHINNENQLPVRQPPVSQQHANNVNQLPVRQPPVRQPPVRQEPTLQHLTHNKRKRKRRASSPASSTSSDSSSSFETDIQDLCNMSVSPARKRSYPDFTQEIDLSVAMAIAEMECTDEKVEARQKSIRQKMRKGGVIILSRLEEYDIHTRAENYAATVEADSTFCFVHTNKTYVSSTGNGASYLPYNDLCTSEKRRRKPVYQSYKHGDYYVMHTQGSKYDQQEGVILPQGLCLMRPPNKLVELVAQAINESPDGMLQVQQVYQAIQNKYPYFNYMDKATITSWRSSIRHALYQKWFKKVPFQTDIINCKGCYWAINRKHRPREWNLPARPQEDSSDEEHDDIGDFPPDQLEAVATILNGLEVAGQLNLEEFLEKPSSSAQGDVPPIDLNCPSPIKGPVMSAIRDPDPMLAQATELLDNSQDQDLNMNIDCLLGDGSKDPFGLDLAALGADPTFNDNSFLDRPWSPFLEQSQKNMANMYQDNFMSVVGAMYPFDPDMSLLETLEAELPDIYTSE